MHPNRVWEKGSKKWPGEERASDQRTREIGDGAHPPVERHGYVVEEAVSLMGRLHPGVVAG
jgi:hypothetical protein